MGVGTPAASAGASRFATKPKVPAIVRFPLAEMNAAENWMSATMGRAVLLTVPAGNAGMMDVGDLVGNAARSKYATRLTELASARLLPVGTSAVGSWRCVTRGLVVLRIASTGNAGMMGAGVTAVRV